MLPQTPSGHIFDSPDDRAGEADRSRAALPSCGGPGPERRGHSHQPWQCAQTGRGIGRGDSVSAGFILLCPVLMGFSFLSPCCLLDFLFLLFCTFVVQTGTHRRRASVSMEGVCAAVVSGRCVLQRVLRVSAIEIYIYLYEKEVVRCSRSVLC